MSRVGWNVHQDESDSVKFVVYSAEAERFAGNLGNSPRVTMTASRPHRPGNVTVLCLLYAALGFYLLLTAIFAAIWLPRVAQALKARGGDQDVLHDNNMFTSLTQTLIGIEIMLALSLLVAAAGLWRIRPWARRVALTISWIMLGSGMISLLVASLSYVISGSASFPHATFLMVAWGMGMVLFEHPSVQNAFSAAELARRTPPEPNIAPATT